jgi:replicative DNA helicase Mcm
MSEIKDPTFTDSALSDKAKEFLMNFKDSDGNYKYVDQIDTMFGARKISFELDIVDISGEKVFEELLSINPERFIDAFSRAGKETLQIRFPDYAEKIQHKIKVRIANFPIKYNFDEVNSDVIGKMVKVTGMVLRITEIKPRPQKLVFVCPDQHPTEINMTFNETNEDLKVPVVCDNPSCKHRDFELKAGASRFIDYQKIRLQEATEDIPPGHRPSILDIDLMGDLTNIVNPGDKINLTGLARLVQEAKFSQKNSTFSFNVRITGNHIEYVDGKNAISVDDADKEQLDAMAEHEDFIDRLVAAFAPHVKGNELIKEALIYGLVGSEEINLGNGIRKRADIHQFLVGDPGGAKSEMLKFATMIAPRGFFTTGKGSSGVGLTASVVQDKNGLYTLEAGPMVLGDKGLVAIDEFDKMKPEDKGNLHEVMEQQTVSIAKGGITTTLTARATVIAAANPVYGKWDPFKSLFENVKDVPIPLLTRFDLIFIVRDLPNKEKDSGVADHIFDIYSKKRLSSTPIENDMLTKYITYARSKPSVKLPSNLKELIKDYYLKIRQDSDPLEITITPRQLEAIIRLSIARARARLADEVDAFDVGRAIYITEECIKQIATDPETNKVDFGILEGKPKAHIKKEKLWDDLLIAYGSNEINIKEITEKMVLTSEWDDESARQWIHEKFSQQRIQGTKEGHFRKSQ